MSDDIEAVLRLADLPRPVGEKHEMDPPHHLCLGDDPCICIHLEGRTKGEAMTDHLPECIFKPENVDSAKGIRWGGRPCICDELRACEQRVLDAALRAVNNEWSLDPMWQGTNWNNTLSAALAAIDAFKESK